LPLSNAASGFVAPPAMELFPLRLRTQE